MNERKIRILAARLLIGVVLIINMQCALAFLVAPTRFAPGFELEGPAGEGMVRGIGILFIMWNVPYAVAFSNPVLRITSLIEATVMQAIGFAGESFLLATFPDGHAAIRATVGRFIMFDGAGLAILLLSIWLVWQVRTGVAKSLADKI